MRLESDDEGHPLNVSLQQTGTDLVSNLTFPVVVRRAGRVMCRTNTRDIELNAQEVIDIDSSTLALTLSTTSDVNMEVRVTVSLERNNSNWETIEDSQ